MRAGLKSTARTTTNLAEHMGLNRLLWLLLFASALFGCGKPVPADKAAYVGEWKGKAMYLLITQQGFVRYKRLKGVVTTSIEAPLVGFNGHNFDVGMHLIVTTFVVSQPPYEDDGTWKMVVDDVELTKTTPDGAGSAVIVFPPHKS